MPTNHGGGKDMLSEGVQEMEREVVESQPRRVLIIDDDAEQAFCLKHRLDKLGYRTDAAHTGKDGLHLARQLRPHVILLDLRLPDCNGLDVCRTLVDTPETCDIPVIIVSGMEQAKIVRGCRSAGSRFYLRKPYDPNALLALIEASWSW